MWRRAVSHILASRQCDQNRHPPTQRGLTDKSAKHRPCNGTATRTSKPLPNSTGIIVYTCKGAAAVVRRRTQCHETKGDRQDSPSHTDQTGQPSPPTHVLSDAMIFRMALEIRASSSAVSRSATDPLRSHTHAHGYNDNPTTRPRENNQQWEENRQ
jgi:hypothetical protein